MSEMGLRTVFVLLAGSLLLALLLLARPGYLASPSMLGAVVAVEVVLAAVCRYRQAFFPVLMGAFLWAGLGIPFHGEWLQGRWFVLAAGALAGLAIYMKDRNHHFGTFHLVALFSVLGAMISALVSAYPEEALLKAVSLLLLFVYGTAGARIAVPALDPGKFFRRLVVVCEVLTYVTAVSYFLLRVEIYGSPNSLGAVMGVAVVPLLLWGMLTSQTVVQRRRLGFELGLAMLLLMSSFARAGIAGAAVACVLVCATLRQYRLIAKGIAAGVVMAIAVVMFVPLPDEVPRWDGSQPISEMFLYKGKHEQGVLGSRQTVWNQTWSVIQDHPWFGSGFGTSLTGDDLTKLPLAEAHIDSRIVREHGNSYLAIMEWTGLLGVVPFFLLVSLTAVNAAKVFSWMRRTGDAFSPAVPVAAVVVAALIHATFEDWMFAVGYYLCVFFWALAFILVDLAPTPAVIYSRESAATLESQYMAMASGQ